MRNPGKAAKWAARGERLSAALRENLKRRKAQARGRAAAPPSEEAPDAAVGVDRNDVARPHPQGPDFRRNRSND